MLVLVKKGYAWTSNGCYKTNVEGMQIGVDQR